jgi:hypothetical protein
LLIGVATQNCAGERRVFPFDKFKINNMIFDCYMNTDSTVRFVGALLDLIDDFVSEFRSRMIATQLIRSVAATAAQYRAAQRTRRSTFAKMCLVLEEAEHPSSWLERMERNRLSRRLEPVRQALFVADEIIEKTFSTRRNVRCLPSYTTVSSAVTKSSRSRTQ